MSQAELARRAVVSAATIVNFEVGVSIPRPSDLAAILAALARAGVEFDRGVRLREGKG
jgi:predicted transcriptional regulator